MNEQILNELKALRDLELLAANIPSEAEIARQLQAFQSQFSPGILRSLDGLALLHRMHARNSTQPRCMAYWMEFKNDDEFSCSLFGGIAGGNALKFGIYQDPKHGVWISGSPNSPKEVSEAQAIAIAREQRDELVAGSNILQSFEADAIDAPAAQMLQLQMQTAAPNLVSSGWAHKYWCLSHPAIIDGYHSPKLQRFHLIKLLQMPPDEIGILDGSAPRFICTSRYCELAKALNISLTTLCRILNKRDSAYHRYWKVGTTEGSTGDSLWSEMHSGEYVSIGWASQVGDLTEVIGRKTAKSDIKELLRPLYSDAKTASRKAGEILNFAKEISEKDLVLATDGQTVLGIGRVVGPYRYQKGLTFPHVRPVQWLLIETWKLPELEAPRTTVAELGKYPRNLLALEEKLQNRSVAEIPLQQKGEFASEPVSDLDLFDSNLLSILARKGQAILYGPPGTGKTYRALMAVNEFAARKAFRKSFSQLSQAEQAKVTSDNGLVRICTFHPGWGYEDFMEGLKPTTVNGNLVFEPRDGAFKRLCIDAESNKNHDYFLVIDEINRGDLPRIFGELITIIELDKRDKRILLPVTGDKFQIPKNVFIVGTMNTADRSVTLLDSALRRRFGFMELMPDSSRLKALRIGDFRLGPWLDALNSRIREHLKRDARDLQIGHAYLLPHNPITSIAEFARILRYDIIPLLQDYCFDDFDTLKDILGNRLVDLENSCISEELFEPNRGEDLIQEISYPEMAKFNLMASAEDSGIETSEEIEDADAVTDEAES